MKHLELFAGIGGFRRALELLQEDKIMKFQNIGFSEIDKNAIKTYKANYHIGENEIELGDIVEFTSKQENINNLPNFNLLTGGFPCQTFSLMGDMAGFGEDRGKMFFRIWKILKTKQPKYVMLENVKNLKTHNKGKTYTVIKNKLEEIGYQVSSGVFNTADFGLPQTRNRVIIFAILNNDKIFNLDNHIHNIKQHFEYIKNNASINCYLTVLDILSKEADQKYYLSERVKPTILSDGTGGFLSKSEINKHIARPLTASMHKMHRACQDNYYSDTFILSHGSKNDALGLTKEEISKLRIRKLTPKEAFMLQGFPGDFVYSAHEKNVSNGALYKQAGNAISVNVVYAIMRYLIDINIIK